LNEFKIEIAPLRERREDIIVFSEYFLKSSNRELNKEIKGFEKSAFEKLQNYFWHGNLRELRNVIKRSVLLCQENKIKQIHLPSEITTPTFSENSSLSVSFNGGIPGSLKTVAEEAEKKAIIETLRFTNNNKSKTAELLEVDRKTLYNKLKSYNIDI